MGLLLFYIYFRNFCLKISAVSKCIQFYFDNIDIITFHLDLFTYEDIMYDLSKINRDKANQCKW